MSITTPTLYVDEAIKTRQSIRAFLPTPIEPQIVQSILEVAARAPSGTNTQPWRVYVLQGNALQTLIQKVVTVHDQIRQDPTLASQYQEEYDYYPTQWVSPYVDRRRENGWGLYGLLGIGKGDKDKMHEQQQRNFKFFDAPVGLMFTIDRIMGRGSLLDYGMFLQNIMIAARARGLHTCAQAAWNGFQTVVLPHIGATEQEMLVCGMSLGYADPQAKVNEFHTPRVDVRNFTTWLS